VRERDRQALEGALPGDGYRMVVEVFIESGPRGQLSTWQLDLKRPAGAGADELGETPWRVVAHDRLSQVDTLHRLTLNAERMYQAHDLVIRSVDYELRLATGAVFVADTAEGVTAAVLLGDGLMTFKPTPKTEQGQARLFAGDDRVESRFDVAFVRINPFDFAPLLSDTALTAAPADPRLLTRAREVFDEDVAKSFSLDLSDLSRDTWSILPQPGDLVAEVRTRRFRTLTYARAGAEAEDVTFFTRERQKNIAIYASPQKLASRGAFYDEDDLTEYDILDHEIDLDVTPERDWITGTSTMRLRVKSFVLGALNLKLADTLTVSSITSRELGRLLFLRVRNQNAIVVNLPSPVSRDYELTLSRRSTPSRSSRNGRCCGPRTSRSSRPSPTGSSATAPTGIRRRPSPTTPPPRCAWPCRRSTPWRPRACRRRASPSSCRPRPGCPPAACSPTAPRTPCATSAWS
jgi:hypothetical protein